MKLGFAESVLFSLAQAAVAATWALKYGAARRARKYSEGRQSIGRDERFRAFGKVIFVATNVVTFASFWSDAGVLLLLPLGGAVRGAGVVVLVAATLLYVKSMKSLGENYSPCFDSHLPRRIVTHGPYRYVRHPLYLANILQGFGHTLASGSLWVLALSAYGLFKILKALAAEEAYLSEKFPGYEDYRAQTSRLIPFVY